jgi:hypothetical protein
MVQAATQNVQEKNQGRWASSLASKKKWEVLGGGRGGGDGEGCQGGRGGAFGC